MTSVVKSINHISYMNSEIATLYSSAHRLLTLGIDGTPIYADDFTRLNRDVYEQALQLYGTSVDTPESEAELCLGLLIAFSATIYDNGRKQQYIQQLLDRSYKVLPQLSSSPLKARLLSYCYSESYDESLAQAAHTIINTWGKTDLTQEQMKIIEELKNFEENQYPWEEVGG